MGQTPEGATLWTLGDANLIEDSTVIPAGKCALILDPDYTGGTSTQPYERLNRAPRF